MTSAQLVAVAGLSLSLAFSTPVIAKSQESDSLHFRKGQWAIESSFGYSSLGLLRFLSPRSAIVVDVSGYFRAEKRRYEADTDPDARSAYSNMGVQLGRRAYRPLSANAATLFSTGLAVNRSTQTEGYMRDVTMAYGLFFEAGGAWFPIRRLSIQVLAGSSAVYTRGKTDYSDNQFVSDYSTTGYSINPVTATVSATFYFR